MSIDKKLESAVASIEMEGFHVRNEYKEWCRQVLENKMTMEQYIQLVLEQAGVDA